MAFQKVMISGVNTAELTVLKEEEKIALLKEIRDTGSKEARDRLIQGNLRLVLSVIQRFASRPLLRYPNHSSLLITRQK